MLGDPDAVEAERLDHVAERQRGGDHAGIGIGDRLIIGARLDPIPVGRILAGHGDIDLHRALPHYLCIAYTRPCRASIRVAARL